MATEGHNSIRAFIAISISEDTRRAIAGLMEELKSRLARDKAVKWVKPENIHITLKFMGNIDVDIIPDIVEAMKRACAGIEPFEVDVSGVGAFPNLKKPRVFWAGIKEKSGEMARLARELEKELKSLGFEPENRPFKSHLTIGRVRRGDKPNAATDELLGRQEKSFGSFRVTQIKLFKSDLQPGGAVYTVLEKVTFG